MQLSGSRGNFSTMSKRRQFRRPNATGRSDTSRFVRLDYRILSSNPYRSLTPNARSLLVELIMLYNGENNGSLYLGVRDAAHRLGVADHHAASSAFDELQKLGFIELTADAYFSVKASNKSRARCWRLPWLSGPGKKAPSWTFIDKEPEPKTMAHKRMERGLRAIKAYRKARDQNKFPEVDSTTLNQFRPETAVVTVVDSTTLNQRNGGKLPNGIMVDSHHYISTSEGAHHDVAIGWWKPGWTASNSNWAFLTILICDASQSLSERAMR